MSEILAEHGYLADDSLATSLFLALRMGRPLCSKVKRGRQDRGRPRPRALERGRARAPAVLRRIDASQAVYEWDYARQLLHLRAAEMTGPAPIARRTRTLALFRGVLVRRPLLRAIAGAADDGPVPIL